MGKTLKFFAEGALGHIFTCNNNPNLLVKQLQDETDGGSELVKEYHIADFLGKILPDFVAAPFSLKRAVTSPDYDEKLCLFQQRVHGKTILDIDSGDFTKKELWSMFLQFNEFILRLGDKIMMQDVHCENAMVDTRIRGDPRIKFIDFGFWKVEDPTTSKSCMIMLSNLYFAFGPMKRLCVLMGFDCTEWDNTYDRFLRYSEKNTAELLKLPSKLVHLWSTAIIRDGVRLTTEDILSEEFRVVEKLCTIRYIQDKVKIPIDVISYQADLNYLIEAMPRHTASEALSKLWSHSSDMGSK